MCGVATEVSQVCLVQEAWLVCVVYLFGQVAMAKVPPVRGSNISSLCFAAATRHRE